jgi:hypothetical protein
MKRYITHDIFVFLGALISLILIGCNSSTQWNDLEFYNVEKLEQLTESPIETNEEDSDAFAQLHKKENREMDVKVDMQFLKSDNMANERVGKLINDQLVEILLKQSSELTVDEAVAQYIEDVKKEFHGDEVASIYYDHLTGRAEYGRENIINYRLVEDVFMGGAHPCTITTILRFNAMTGEFIALENLFPYPQQKELQELLLEKLMKMNQARSLEDLHKRGILEMSDMFISNNFALREDSIEFYYNEYDIAPYAYGAFSICLSYEEVQKLMPSMQENQ